MSGWQQHLQSGLGSRQALGWGYRRNPEQEQTEVTYRVCSSQLPPRPSSHAGVTLQPCWRPPPCSLDIMTHADLRAFAWLASWPRAPLSLILSSAHPSPRLSALLAQCPPPSSCRANAPHPPGCPQSPAHPVERLGKTVVPISQVRKSRLRGRGQRSDRERHLEAPPPPLPSPSPPGQRHFLLLRGLWGPRAAGGAPNGSWGLCVWQRQLGLLEPNPHSECEWEVGEGEQQLAPGPVPVRNLCGVELPWDCLSVSLFWPLSLYLPLPICLCLFSFCFSLCLCLSISLCVCLCLSRSLPLCVSLSICLSSELGD